MKNLKTVVLTLAIVMLSVSFGFSQKGGNCPKNPNGDPMIFQVIPDLTQDQKDQILNDRNDMMKTMTPLRADLKVKQAELDALMAKNSTTKEKEAKVKEISDLKVKIQMVQIKHHDNVRALLTDDQKVVFDNWQMKKHSKMKYGHGRGMRPGQHQGMRPGQNQGMNK